MKKFPNASIISILTVDDADDKKNILFIYLKPVPDIYESDQLYWYDKGGKGGLARNIWETYNVKHWFCIGTDQDIAVLYDQIISQKECQIGDKKLLFAFPEYEIEPYEQDLYIDRGQNAVERLRSPNVYTLAPPLYQKENLEILTGHKTAAKGILNMTPPGLYDDNFIYKNLADGIFGVKELRRAYMDFHGSKPDNTDSNQERMTGFYQENFKPGFSYQAIFSDQEGNEIGATEIDTTNGTFSLEVNDRRGKGKITVRKNGTVQFGMDYTLLRDLSFSAHVAERTFRDAYGREFLKTDSSDERPPKFDSFTWQKEVYAVEEKAGIVLSDKFHELLHYLGPRILIADPYFMGNVITGNGKLAFCQSNFLNGMLHAIAFDEVSEITIMGVNGRANQHSGKDDSREESKTEQRFEHYEKLFKHLFSDVVTGISTFPEINFVSAASDFHNRYWFSISEDKKSLEKCIAITNSLGNMNEVDLLPIEHESQLRQVTLKYYQLYQNSNHELKI